MLMGRLPGSLPVVTNVSGYTGAQRFAGTPLQPYPLPQPVPRMPIMPPPPAPPAPTLPAAIEAWRAQLLAMNPFYLSQQFSMPAAQIRQLLADPQMAVVLYQQAHRRTSPFGRHGEGGRGFGSATSPESIGREIEGALRGYTDDPRGLMDIASNMANTVSGLGAVQALAATAAEGALGLEQGRLGGYKSVRGRTVPDQDLIDKIGTQKPGGGVYSKTDVFNDQRARNEQRERERRASRGAGPGNRGPKGGGAYGGMGGVGSHGV